MDIYILDVGHGNATVLRAGDVVVVFDGGLGGVLKEFLFQEGIRDIDLLLISHADQDHIDGITALLVSSQFRIKKIRLNSDASKGSQSWDDLLTNIKISGLDFNPALTSDGPEKFTFDSVNVQVLAPDGYLAAKGPGSNDNHGRRLSSNSMSAVFRIQMDGENIVVLGGDIDQIGLDYLQEAEVDMSAQVLVFPHHGGKPGTKSAKDFVTEICGSVQPSTIIFSVGRSRDGFPRPEIVKELLLSVPKTRIVCTQLTKSCAAKTASSGHSHLNGYHAAGKSANSCCGGTIKISYTSGALSISPDLSSHRAFIAANANSALCV